MMVLACSDRPGRRSTARPQGQILFGATYRNVAASRALIAEDVGEDKRCHNRRVGFNDESRRLAVELAPGDFFVGHGAAIGAVGSGAVGDLAEISPEAALLAQVLH